MNIRNLNLNEKNGIMLKFDQNVIDKENKDSTTIELINDKKLKDLSYKVEKGFQTITVEGPKGKYQAIIPAYNDTDGIYSKDRICNSILSTIFLSLTFPVYPIFSTLTKAFAAESATFQAAINAGLDYDEAQKVSKQATLLGLRNGFIASLVEILPIVLPAAGVVFFPPSMLKAICGGLLVNETIGRLISSEIKQFLKQKIKEEEK